MHHYKYNDGMAYFEVLVSLIIIFIMIGVFLDRVFSVSIEVERANLNHNLSIIRTELQLFSFREILLGNGDELLNYEGSNPMELVNNRPPTYLKSLSNTVGMIPVGAWYFDREKGELTYKVVNEKHFYDDGRQSSEARYQLKFFYNDKNNDKRFSPNIDYVNGLTLMPLGDYGWH